jgi:hypothetical protein
LLITKEFVILQLPKTGTIFVRDVMKSLYRERLRRQPLRKVLMKLRLLQPQLREVFTAVQYRSHGRTHHGGYFQIPPQYRDRKILSVIRNPFTQFESVYRFKWWVGDPLLDRNTIDLHFPHFPNLTIDDFVRVRELVVEQRRNLYKIPEQTTIGFQTIQFIRMYFKDPATVFPKLSATYMQGNSFLDDIAPVHFIRQEDLNDELADVLASVGYSTQEVAFVRNHRRVHMTDPKQASTGHTLTGTAMDRIERQEWFLFKMLEKLGFAYSRPDKVFEYAPDSDHPLYQP